MSERPLVHVARAGVEDVPELARLAERTFRDTFATQNSAADMESYAARAFSPETLRRELADEGSDFLLARREGESRPLGYAKLKAGRAATAVSGPRPVELERLYVVEEAIGSGLGSALMNSCLEAARAAGYETLWLGVWEHNPRAIAFYRRWGFVEVGDHTFTLGSEGQRDLVMELALEPCGA